MTETEDQNPAPGAPGFRVERHGAVPSTNTLAFERARAGDLGHIWMTATEQTAGRGRRGRHWASNQGNLFASLLLINPAPTNRLPELPMVAAVALSKAIDLATGGYHLAKLKWPNDLLVSGAKLSGILLEAETLVDNRTAVVLGFGVNCVTHPHDALYPCTDLAALGYRVSAEDLFHHLASSLADELATWNSSNGFSQIRSGWLERAAHLRQQVTVRNGDEAVTGQFHNLDDRGHLVLKLDNGSLKTIFAGDVFLPEQG
ncbi:biotin-(acetyl-CoA-carboxylase) ligase [Roseibium sp. TrichSKD4]|uniref:biotin--[acetyl-CoA-carboxylase] ligase n=1 Tax=Roseibium sp. TrichSKD4 TaxID=744980 RepID=UPI0001E566D5|nr:biotin--[acetyl-CoA-carboxylase] ligase [Roseibium sp. TrichSKD4]EFO33629.1 biotin-(acetyl-CoA-carboxylase) ligase [Roseibium sp. TrichSKD4]